MTNLPVCRLCKSETTDKDLEDSDGNIDQDEFLVSCPNDSCPCSTGWFSIQEWRKLMYVPAKKEYNDDSNKLPLFESGYYVEGYNAAIIDMERGEPQ